MIKKEKDVFYLNTNNLSYVFHVDKTGLLIHDYFGQKLEVLDGDFTPLSLKCGFAKGTSVIYDEKINDQLSMDLVPLECSFPHKGDFKSTPVLLKNEKFGYVFDFKYNRFEIREAKPLEGLPTPHDAKDELVVVIKDEKANVEIELHYLVFEDSDVITRSLAIVNQSELPLTVLRALSYQLDMVNKEFELTTLSGGWASEMNQQVQLVKEGKYSVESKTGFSSARFNPFFMLKERTANLDHGEVYSFNLIYSGNHLAEVELTHYGLLRVEAGINPFCFEHILKTGEKFETPYAVLTYSNKGVNGARQNMHHFTNNHVIPSQWNNTLRPVVINNWEATTFNFNEKKIVTLAKDSKKYGAELVVLDDGWFGQRNNDLAGLGDYSVIKKKLPHGLEGLSKKIHNLGLKFGLWFEPESVNPDSDCFRAHPDWAIQCKDRTPSLSRHQLLLDLSNKDVQDYIIENICRILKNANIDYVKWDMNRNMSDIRFNDYPAGEFYHRYMLGLYRVMDTITKRFPNVLFEGCASGGNRFDLGILSYFPQIWTSDDSDCRERLTIQSGTYLGYPLSTVSAHVSASPSQHMLRRTPIDTRFNVAMFGDFGYELFFSEMTNFDKKRCKALIEIYKKYREVFQFGDFYELNSFTDNFVKWQVVSKNKKTSIIGHFNILQKSNAPECYLDARGLLDDQVYDIEGIQQEIDIRDFGSLVNMITPFHVNPNGALVRIIAEHRTIICDHYQTKVYGSVLNNRGLLLEPEWSSTGLNDKIRVLKDFGSRLYIIKAHEEN